MTAFLYGIRLHWKMNIRNRQILIHYYIVPLLFYLLMGGVFTSILPDANQTLIQSMTVFGVSLGGVLGAPFPLTEIFGSEIKKAYQVGGIPFWTVAASHFISALLHLFLMSMVILLSAPFVFDAKVPENLPVFFCGLLLLLLSTLSVGTVFGLFLKNSSKVGMMTQFIFLPSVLLSGIMFPASMLPKPLQYAGKLLPATWGYEAMCAPVCDAGLLLPMALIFLLLAALSAWKLKQLYTL